MPPKCSWANLAENNLVHLTLVTSTLTLTTLMGSRRTLEPTIRLVLVNTARSSKMPPPSLRWTFRTLTTTSCVTKATVCHRYDFSGTSLERTYIFSNFFDFTLFFGIDHDPHVLYDSHDLCLFSFLCFSSHDDMAKRSHCRIMILFDFRVQTILRTHFHPHSLLPPQTHHPYTPRLRR